MGLARPDNRLMVEAWHREPYRQVGGWWMCVYSSVYAIAMEFLLVCACICVRLYMYVYNTVSNDVYCKLNEVHSYRLWGTTSAANDVGPCC